MIRVLPCLLLFGCSLAAQAEELHLDDGRTLWVTSHEIRKGLVVAETAFGPLVFPGDRLADLGQLATPSPLGILRVSESALLLVESDLDRDRHRQLSEGLEIFARYLVRHYGLEKGDLPGSPYRLRAWRRRADFKQTQDRLAPAISQRKGRAFGEGVAGFYAPDIGEVHFWDGASGRVGARMELAQHELTHLFNHLLARSMGRGGMPTWFEEGTAVYYSMTIADETLDGRDPPEPLEHAASLVEVISDLENDRAYPLADLLDVPYDRFLGREYSWSWALVRELRQGRKGELWTSLLDWLQSGQEKGIGAVLGRKFAAFEKDWHRRTSLAAPLLVDRHLRRNERLVAVATAMKNPSPELARSYRSIARSYASVAMAEPAIAFFEAAWRGGAEDALDRLLVARLRARLAGLADDELWSETARSDLRRAVEGDALLAEARFVFGEQLALAGDTEAARRELSFALLLATAGDDVESIVLSLLRLQGDEESAELAKQLTTSLPALKPAIDRAGLYRLQEQGRFRELMAVLDARAEAGLADGVELLMLADLEMLVDRADQAAPRLRQLLLADPLGHHLRPRLARALIAAGEPEAARRLRTETHKLALERGLDLGFVLDRIDAALESR